MTTRIARGLSAIGRGGDKLDGLLPGSWVARCLTTMAICALLGLPGWIDARMVGPERYASLQDIGVSAEYAGSFLWQVGGMAALGFAGWLVYEVGAWRTRVRYARRESDYQARKQAEAEDPRNWSPERRRRAFRSIAGGRS